MDVWLVVAILLIGIVLVSLGIFIVMTIWEVRQIRGDDEAIPPHTEETTV